MSEDKRIPAHKVNLNPSISNSFDISGGFSSLYTIFQNDVFLGYGWSYEEGNFNSRSNFPNFREQNHKFSELDYDTLSSLIAYAYTGELTITTCKS